MTYNFDPDRWYDNELAALKRKRLLGIISESEFERLVQDLDDRHDGMWKRLDGAYQLPTK